MAIQRACGVTQHACSYAHVIEVRPGHFDIDRVAAPDTATKDGRLLGAAECVWDRVHRIGDEVANGKHHIFNLARGADEHAVPKGADEIIIYRNRIKRRLGRTAERRSRDRGERCKPCSIISGNLLVWPDLFLDPLCNRKLLFDGIAGRDQQPAKNKIAIARGQIVQGRHQANGAVQTRPRHHNDNRRAKRPAAPAGHQPEHCVAAFVKDSAQQWRQAKQTLKTPPKHAH